MSDYRNPAKIKVKVYRHFRDKNGASEYVDTVVGELYNSSESFDMMKQFLHYYDIKNNFHCRLNYNLLNTVITDGISYESSSLIQHLYYVTPDLDTEDLPILGKLRKTAENNTKALAYRILSTAGLISDKEDKLSTALLAIQAVTSNYHLDFWERVGHVRKIVQEALKQNNTEEGANNETH